MKKVFVSGCYDIIHAGHIQFFEDAKSLGDYLIVCFASAPVLELAKHRKPSLPDDNKKIILSSISCVDEVLESSDIDPIFDFRTHVDNIRPAILAVTEDDQNTEAKRKFCEERGIQFKILQKRNLATQISTTSILTSIKDLHELPLRVDFAGGWLDVPSFTRPDGYIVNCTITPKVSLSNWPYEKSAGLGGSAAYALLQSKSGIKSEVRAGVGWQDPAVISETGLCVWRSNINPTLEVKINPDWLEGKMLIVWTGKMHKTFDMTNIPRDYDLIKAAGLLGRDAVYARSLEKLAKAVSISYEAQIKEGMAQLPKMNGAISRKYLGGGHGGYALYLFESKNIRDKAHMSNNKSKCIEPYIKMHE